MPIMPAIVIIVNSFSGTPLYCCDGSFTIHEPPVPSAGMVSPPPLPSFLNAENFNCTPASENRNAFGRASISASSSSGGASSPSEGCTVTAPGRSRPNIHSRKNSRVGFTPARSARYLRSGPSGRRFEKNGGTTMLYGRNFVTSAPNGSL
ncbi:hypothetical protein D3C87_1580350 [compost metagenome]